MAEYEEKSVLLDDGTRVPVDKNGVPYPAHVVAEDLSDFPQSVDEQDEDDNDSYLADDFELDEEDEAYDPDEECIDDYGYVRNKDFAMNHSGYDRTLLALQRAGVPFGRTNSITFLPDGTLELYITQAH